MSLQTFSLSMSSPAQPTHGVNQKGPPAQLRPPPRLRAASNVHRGPGPAVCVEAKRSTPAHDNLKPPSPAAHGAPPAPPPRPAAAAHRGAPRDAPRPLGRVRARRAADRKSKHPTDASPAGRTPARRAGEAAPADPRPAADSSPSARLAGPSPAALFKNLGLGLFGKAPPPLAAARSRDVAEGVALDLPRDVVLVELGEAVELLLELVLQDRIVLCPQLLLPPAHRRLHNPP
eukprot:CAMPEP_0206221434 /NCGR_PEP_ID=MMETSP0047_2-20121206/5411_1 /ASSEMBLY_ACC=CAM_ASM_000192 /TAXON_ID=195065 /ORGANISM="Chroomonas mesostigmatica_cf, Strain CCMP1168" /LENGTH=231 /DNA_ID=CAMNT_0053644165 /DNA_START=107 /DNA_END=800 /DNA_ORIENTATION=+